MRLLTISSLIILTAAPALAGHIHLSGGISLFTPPEPGADSTPLYKLGVSYWFTKRASANVEFAYAGYRIEGVKYYYVPSKLRLIGHPRAGRLLDPYCGGGFIYSKKKNDHTGWNTKFGYTGLLGFNFLILHDTTVGGYGEYVVPDWHNTDGYREYGFNFSGLAF
jgi:hypothetical protein